MKRSLKIFCAALLFGTAAVCGAEETATDVSPAPSEAPSSRPAKKSGQPLKNGGIEQGGTTVAGSNDKSETLIQSGNRVIYQKDGASVFSSALEGRTPQYVNDREGRVRQVTPVPKAKPISNHPNPVTPHFSGSQPTQRESRPSPAAQRPSGSSLPHSPFLRPNPVR